MISVEKHERQNPFSPIYALCNQGNSKKKLANLPEFPRLLDIELTNNCNFHCLFCPTGTGAIDRNQGFLTDELYEKILDEIEPYKTPLRFIRWGEPTMHPRWLRYIEAAKARGITCHINTNGSYLNPEIIQRLVELPLDSIKFSFQGVDTKSYREMRNIDFFDKLLARVRMLWEARGERPYPYMHVSTTITYETREQVDRFKAEVSPYVDLLTVGRTNFAHIDVEQVRLSEKEKQTLRDLAAQESLVRRHSECQEVFDKLSINWDGSVSACCHDYDDYMLVGNLERDTIAECWTSPKMNAYRRMLADMRHDELELCRTCYDIYGLRTPGLQDFKD